LPFTAQSKPREKNATVARWLAGNHANPTACHNIPGGRAKKVHVFGQKMFLLNKFLFWAIL
jgi:hypothetical protein